MLFPSFRASYDAEPSRVETTHCTLSFAHRGKSIGGRSPLSPVHGSIVRLNSTKILYILNGNSYAVGQASDWCNFIVWTELRAGHQTSPQTAWFKYSNFIIILLFVMQRKQGVKLLVATWPGACSDSFAAAVRKLLRSEDARRYLRVGFISCCWFILLVNVYSKSVSPETFAVANGMRTTTVNGICVKKMRTNGAITEWGTSQEHGNDAACIYFCN